MVCLYKCAKISLDYVIYSCNVGCEKKAKHFPCCQCPKTYINKGAIKMHLCSAHPIATCNPEPQPVSHSLQEPPSHQCVHLSSVDYTCAVAPSEDLSEHVLTEMVERKWIGNIRKNGCL